MSKERIELREFKIGVGVGVFDLGIASHQYFIRYNDQNEIIGEVHGLATDPMNNTIKTVGTTHDLLKVWKYPQPNQHSSISSHIDGGLSGLYKTDQSFKVMVEGNESVVARWEAALNATTALAFRTITYNPLGGDIKDVNVGNSNSIARTLGDVLGFPTQNISGRFVIGQEKNLITPKYLSRFISRMAKY
jgi:hypothetical protein